MVVEDVGVRDTLSTSYLRHEDAAGNYETTEGIEFGDPEHKPITEETGTETASGRSMSAMPPTSSISVSRTVFGGLGRHERYWIWQRVGDDPIVGTGTAMA